MSECRDIGSVQQVVITELTYLLAFVRVKKIKVMELRICFKFANVPVKDEKNLSPSRQDFRCTMGLLTAHCPVRHYLKIISLIEKDVCLFCSWQNGDDRWLLGKDQKVFWSQACHGFRKNIRDILVGIMTRSNVNPRYIYLGSLWKKSTRGLKSKIN